VDALRWRVDDLSKQCKRPTQMKVSNEFHWLGSRFRKIDGQAREGVVVENLSEEFDPGSD